MSFVLSSPGSGSAWIRKWYTSNGPPDVKRGFPQHIRKASGVRECHRLPSRHGRRSASLRRFRAALDEARIVSRGAKRNPWGSTTLPRRNAPRGSKMGHGFSGPGAREPKWPAQQAAQRNGTLIRCARALGCTFVSSFPRAFHDKYELRKVARRPGERGKSPPKQGRGPCFRSRALGHASETQATPPRKRRQRPPENAGNAQTRAKPFWILGQGQRVGRCFGRIGSLWLARVPILPLRVCESEDKDRDDDESGQSDDKDIDGHGSLLKCLLLKCFGFERGSAAAVPEQNVADPC